MTITNLTDKELSQAQRIVELEAENAALLKANLDCVDRFNEIKLDYDALRAQIETVPTEVTEVAQVAIESVLREYNYPANPKNAARAGWRACRLHIAAMKGAI